MAPTISAGRRNEFGYGEGGRRVAGYRFANAQLAGFIPQSISVLGRRAIPSIRYKIGERSPANINDILVAIKVKEAVTPTAKAAVIMASARAKGGSVATLAGPTAVGFLGTHLATLTAGALDTDVDTLIATGLATQRGVAAYAALANRFGVLPPGIVRAVLAGKRRIPVDFYPTDNHLHHRFTYRPQETTLTLSQIHLGYKEPFAIWSRKDKKLGAIWKTTRGRRSNPNPPRGRRGTLLPASQCTDFGYFNPPGSIPIRGRKKPL